MIMTISLGLDKSTEGKINYNGSETVILKSEGLVIF